MILWLLLCNKDLKIISLCENPGDFLHHRPLLRTFLVQNNLKVLTMKGCGCLRPETDSEYDEPSDCSIEENQRKPENSQVDGEVVLATAAVGVATQTQRNQREREANKRRELQRKTDSDRQRERDRNAEREKERRRQKERQRSVEKQRQRVSDKHKQKQAEKQRQKRRNK
ncbi:putative uncharacterized protein DDB_G0271982 [Xenopus laevis]|uniref:Uncharacterized protein n=2 Tax=Xenopus laevis TaxID=8355 RepID=A0A8J0U9S9_XENLA|nr:putative uncharacterized protein DDB_G0271982 [Xenopus laevis]